MIQVAESFHDKAQVSNPSLEEALHDLGLSPFQVLVPRPSAVIDYVAMHHDLAQLLPEICDSVRRNLGPDVELSLEIYQDPEIDDCYLTLYVRQDTYDMEMMERLDAVSRPFDALLDAVSGYLLITTDFHRPQGE